MERATFRFNWGIASSVYTENLATAVAIGALPVFHTGVGLGMSDTLAQPPANPSASSSPPAQLSPAMRQYQQFKQQHPGYVLFFRMGDFYEMFWEDAKLAAKTLGVALTSRNKGAADEIPMAGVPFHAVEGYLRKMIAAGHKVAICEQTEDAGGGEGAV